MDVKLVFVIVCLCALAIISAEAGIPKCCMTTKQDIKPQTLMRVQRWELQQSNGACEIQALVLYVRGFKKPICAPLTIKKKMKTIHRIMEQKKKKRIF
uniref:Chemokine interleukin-8-like domain-containing protein n=1 Tax=Amphilophus citrinellus TaxID=61819 RepID=A0A3Q0R598_AMPCI